MIRFSLEEPGLFNQECVQNFEMSASERQVKLFEVLRSEGWKVTHHHNDCVSLSPTPFSPDGSFIGYVASVDFLSEGKVFLSATSEVMDFSCDDVDEYQRNLLQMRLDMAFVRGAMMALGWSSGDVKWDVTNL